VDVIHLYPLRMKPDAARALVPLCALALISAVAFVTGVAAGLRGGALLVAPVSLALGGVYLAGHVWLERSRLCRAADEWIARGYEGRAVRYGWRIEELTSAREGRTLARLVQRIVAELSQPRQPSLSPLNGAALRPHRPLLVSLAGHLDDLDRQVSAAGMLALHRLLTEPGSALYARSGVDAAPRDVAGEFTAILELLEVRG